MGAEKSTSAPPSPKDRSSLVLGFDPVVTEHAEKQPPTEDLSEVAQELFEKSKQSIYRHTDHLFAWLMVAQWIAGIIAAVLIAPKTWIGATSQVHGHVWAAIILGGIISSLPIALAILQPGRRSTRYVIAIGQMLWSSLLIHLTGGRIETHFHVFGSLAFLAFYRDWTVLVPATIVVAADHFVRGVFYPQSVFGIMVVSHWRWIEHAAWVIFEDAFLVASCVRSVRDMRATAARAAQLIQVNAHIENVVQERTKALGASEARFRSISAASPTGIFQTDAQGSTIYTNERWQEISGLTAEQSLGTGWAASIHPNDRDELVQEWAVSVAREEGILWECRVVTPEKDIRWISVRSRPIRGENRAVIGHVGTVEDITEQKAAAEQLMQGAYRDSLTGMPNRASFLEALDRAIGHQKRRADYAFAVLFLDLDHFKNVNDSLGHRMGDKLLVSAAERLQSCLRPGDMIARLGGDEFTILLDDVTDAYDATLVAERIEIALSTSFDLEGHTVFVGCSVGITVSTIGYQTGEEIMRDADIAMYRAKSAGRGRFETFDRTMHDRAVKRLQLETDLRHAVERDELFLVYQPIVALPNGDVTGFEALVRWKHPTRGFVSPGDFIPLSEETGLILPIGKFVLAEACRWIAELNRSRPPGRELMVSVNLSGRQLSVANLVQEIEALLREVSLEPKWLKLEITESTIMENADRAAVVLQRLRELGIQLLVDDFGTGYSSLAYLHRFPLNTLKIDRTFVSGSAAGGDQIIRAIVGLAQNLGMGLVAEGIETLEQAERLRALGCEYGQGYYFSKPLEAAAILKLLEAKDAEAVAGGNVIAIASEPGKDSVAVPL